ncbi:hypothetical protein ACHAXS_013611, partial [Conticribra weissflogii]
MLPQVVYMIFQYNHTNLKSYGCHSDLLLLAPILFVGGKWNFLPQKMILHYNRYDLGNYQYEKKIKYLVTKSSSHHPD